MKGIYKITQKSSGRVYIGQSINIDNRWNQHAFNIDNLSFHVEYRKNPTDFIFEVLEQNDEFTADDLNRLEKKYIGDYHSNDSKYGFNATAGNGKDKRGKAIQRMLMVRGSIDKYINSRFLRKTENKKILIIGNFNIGESSLYNNITVLTDDFDYTCETAKIIRVEGGEEIIAQLNMMKDEKFDLIIANPPYNMGNAIISKCVPLAKEIIVLMPFSKYKANNLYKHVLELKIVAEFNQWKDKQYGDNTKKQRDELGQFFTPPEITIQMIESFSCDSLAGKTILDPTIGAGGLIAACIIAGATPELCFGNEYDENILKVCKERLCAMGVPEHNLHQGDATNADCIRPESFIDAYKWGPKTNKVTGIVGTQVDLW